MLIVMMKQAHRWEVDGLDRRLKSVEQRLNQRDMDRFRNAMLLFWIVWVAVLAGMVVLAAQS
jgi:hypothetical protein